MLPIAAVAGLAGIALGGAKLAGTIDLPIYVYGLTPVSYTHLSPAAPRNAIIYEGEVARVWVAHPDKSVELRRVTVGLIRGELVQITDGVKVGEEVVVRGALFIDQMTAAFRR